MNTDVLEFTSIVLFAGCLWHCARYFGGVFAQQWFIAGYFVAIMRETLMQAMVGQYIFAPTILRVGSAPALVTLLGASLTFIAFHFARRLSAIENRVRMAALILLMTTSLSLALEATAAQSQWWIYLQPATTVFGGVHLSAPLAWGGAAVIFYLTFARIRASRLPDRGRTYAMITLSPLIAVAQVLLTLILGTVLG